MSDAEIASIARRLAESAASSFRERTADTKKTYLATLTELCAAVRTEILQKLPPLDPTSEGGNGAAGE